MSLVLFHIANAIAFLAFLFRDQLYLRAITVVSMVLQSVYYFTIIGGPLYNPLFWKAVTFLLNAAMIVLLFRDRIGYGIDPRTRPLYDQLEVLSYGQFRRLVAAGRRIDGPAALIEEGRRPAALYYVLSGEAEVRKAGETLSIGPHIFLGEIAFLTGGTASASVRLAEEAHCIAWDVTVLRALMAKERAIDIALRGLMNRDLAAKTARSALGPSVDRRKAAGDQIAV